MKRQPIILLAILSAAPAIAQQTLKGEVTVQREIIPVEREASPLAMLPVVSLPALQSPGLEYSSAAVKSAVPSLAAFAEPMRRPDPLTSRLHRGYLALTAGPLFNASLSAGYDIIATSSTRLGIWMQYSGEVYSRSLVEGLSYKPYWRDHSVSAGVRLSQSLGRSGRLDVRADYGFERTNGYDAGGRYWVNANSGHFDALWSRTSGTLDVEARAGYGIFATNPIGLEYGFPGVTQHDVKAGGSAVMSLGETTGVGMDADLRLLSTGRHAVINSLSGGWEDADGKTTGLVTLTPYLSFDSHAFSVTAGPRIDFTFNGGKAFHIAPMLKASWTPLSWLAVQAKVAGGERFNTLDALHDEARRSVPYLSYGMSHLPFTADIAVTAGPRKGAWVTLFGGWARANSWLMPSLPGVDIQAIQFEPVDISGFHGGVEAGAAWRSIVELRGSWECAPSGREKGYYLWRDRARHVVSANLAVMPLKPLRVEARWEWRTSRSIITSRKASSDTDGGGVIGEEFSRSLGNVSDLGVRATWKFSEALSVWLAGDNLLDRRNDLLDTTPARGITVMAGVGYRF